MRKSNFLKKEKEKKLSKDEIYKVLGKESVKELVNKFREVEEITRRIRETAELVLPKKFFDLFEKDPDVTLNFLHRLVDFMHFYREFIQRWKDIKIEYEDLVTKVEKQKVEER